MTRTLIVATLTCVLHAGGALAQPAAPPAPTAPPEHIGFGGYAAVGYPAAIVAARFSVPFHPRGALDLDVGRSQARSTFGAAVRLLRRKRQPDGFSDYFIIGALVMDGTIRTDIRFPNARILLEDRRKRISGQLGYGFDGQFSNGTRLGLEFVGGGSDMSGPRLFARLFVVWGPEAHTYR